MDAAYKEQAQMTVDLRHMMLHFTPGASWQSGDLPVYTKGDGCYLWDTEGNKVLDGLAGLFVVHIGHGRHDIVDAIARQLHELAYVPSWSSTHPSALEAAKLVADLAPGDLDSVFFVNSGSEAVESALKFARAYHRSQGQPDRYKVISRDLSYHGVTMGALSATGLDPVREPFKPLLPGFMKVPNTLGVTDGVAAADEIEALILAEGPETVSMVIAEPVQNGGGAIVPPDGYWPRLREICDRHGVLLVADEVINSFGRTGPWFASELVGVVPDILTFAKGATSGYAPIGGMVVRKPIVEAFASGEGGGTFLHGATWGGHPAATSALIANVTALRDEHILAHATEHAPGFRRRLDSLLDAHDVVKEIRGVNYFWAIELCKSRARGEAFTEQEIAAFVNESVPGIIRNADLLIRIDQRGALKLLLSPPLVADDEVLDDLMARVDQVVDRFAGLAT